LKAAIELEWLASIKSALHVYGLYPNHRLRTPGLSHTPEQHRRVREVVERIFGRIEPVHLVLECREEAR
jgi:hypothetical protein